MVLSRRSLSVASSCKALQRTWLKHGRPLYDGQGPVSTVTTRFSSLSQTVIQGSPLPASAPFAARRDGHLEVQSSPSNLLRLAFLGAPGSGKGTVSQWLVRDFQVKTLSTGQALREELLSKREAFDPHLRAAIENGEYVPDETVNLIVLKHLSMAKRMNWILDGYPRTVGQAKFLDQALAAENMPLLGVILMDPPEEVILERLLDRWIHLPSGRVYGSKAARPRIPGLDDVTGEPLVRRPDDQLDVILRRLKTYRASIQPVLDYYDALGLIKKLDASTSQASYEELLSWLRVKGGFQVVPDSAPMTAQL